MVEQLEDGFDSDGGIDHPGQVSALLCHAPCCSAVSPSNERSVRNRLFCPHPSFCRALQKSEVDVGDGELPDAATAAPNASSALVPVIPAMPANPAAA